MRSETKPNEAKRNQTKRNETKYNVVSFRSVSFRLISFRTLQVPYILWLFVLPTYSTWIKVYIYIYIVTSCPTYIHVKQKYKLWLFVRQGKKYRLWLLSCDFLSYGFCDFLSCDFLSVYRFNYHKSLMQIIVFHGRTWNFNKIDILFSYISSNKWDIIYTIHKW